MSLLEDVFLEDEAGEAQELERVIEGDEYDERPLSPNSDDNEVKDDEAEEDKRRVDPTQAKAKRVIKNPRFILNPARLTGPRGIQVIPDHYKDFKFKGKGHEKEDLDMVLKKLEHWAYRLYPKFGFHDCLKKIETLGKKKTVMVHLQKIRSDQFISEETVVQRDSSDDEAPPTVQEEDEFDKLLQQQIELVRATPAPGSVKKTPFSTPRVDRSLMMPKATSSPSISDEQRERMLRNRRMAEERRLAKLKNNSVTESPKVTPDVITELDEVVVRKQNRSQVISSDEDEDASVNKSITVDIHGTVDQEMNDVFDSDNKQTEVGIDDNEEINKAKKHNKSNVIDSSDDEPEISRSNPNNDEITDNIEDKQHSLENTSEFSNKKETDQMITDKNRSNVIESSNEKLVNNHDKISDSNQYTKINSLDNVSRDNNDDNIITIDIDETNEADKLNNVNNTEIMTENNDLRIDENKLAECNNEPSKSSVTNIGLTNENTDNSELNYEMNKEDVDITEEIMDVDISDDF